MFPTLKNHPFAVEAFFNTSTVLTFAVPKAQLLPYLPECLSLDTFNDEYGFMAIAMVDTSNLRPKGFPKAMGRNFFLIGYRVFVNYIDNRGKRLRGLYILKSETNKKTMQFFGNIFTHYHYTTTDVSHTEVRVENEIEVEISSQKSNFHLTMEKKSGPVPLPKHSPFENWKQARRFAGPLPFTFTYNEAKKEVLIIQGVRTNWKPEPIAIKDYSFQFLDQLNLERVKLANAFQVENIPYWWKKGKTELWKP